MDVTPFARACCINLLVVALICLGCSTSGESPARVSFERVEIDGLTTDHNSSGGASWVDIDGDADLDLFVTNGYDVSAPEASPQPNRLDLNDGNGGFVTVSAGVLVESEGFSSGNTWGDYDNDGDLDVFIANQRDQNNMLFRNEGDARFTRIDDEPPAMDGGNSYAASWVDVDGDGWLDLFVANGGMSHIGANGLYRNVGGRFEKITEGAVVADTTATGGFDWGDYDNDGDLDLYIANQGFNPAINANALYRNDGSWNFTKITDSPAVDNNLPSCAVHWVDIDNDIDLDLHVTNLYGLADLLYVNDGSGGLELAEDSPLSLDGGFGYEANWEDYDNDGDIDVAIGNWGSCAYLYLNDGRGGFERAHAGDLVGSVHHAGTMASGDYDNDGDIDIYVANWPNVPGDGELNRMYRNRTAARHWLRVRLIGRPHNRSGIGARVLVTADTGAGSVTQLREVKTHVGFRGQSATAPHFGLGAAENVTAVEVRWPSGKTSRVENIEADRLVEIEEPAGS